MVVVIIYERAAGAMMEKKLHECWHVESCWAGLRACRRSSLNK